MTNQIPSLRDELLIALANEDLFDAGLAQCEERAAVYNAAPDMLKALSDLVGTVKIKATYNGRHYTSDFLAVDQWAVDAARAAIAKATGNNP